VNFPLRYKGVAYYQSSINDRISLSYGSPGGAKTPVEIFLNEPFMIEPLGLEVTISQSDIVGGIFIASDGTRSEVPYTVRLVDYSLQRQGLSDRPVLLGYISEGWPITISGVEVSLDGIEEFTILHYVHDPGVPYVYVGGFILMLGLMFSLYLPWRTGRIVLVPDGDRTKWFAGGNWQGFQDFIAPFGRDGEKD
jgi:cytochrome c biogenesis protein ResB